MIGHRFMGRAHSNAWRQAPRFFNLKANVELHTICGRNAAATQSARAQLGWQHATTDWHEITESPLIDIVDIVTPTSSHAEMAIEAVKNGKHVLCEKPLGLNLKQTGFQGGGTAQPPQGTGEPEDQFPLHTRIPNCIKTESEPNLNAD